MLYNSYTADLLVIFLFLDKIPDNHNLKEEIFIWHTVQGIRLTGSKAGKSFMAEHCCKTKCSVHGGSEAEQRNSAREKWERNYA